MEEYLELFKNYWRNYVNFYDRTTIKGYWVPVLAVAVIGGILGALGQPTDGARGLFDYLASLFSLATFLPGLAIAVRRLRDAGRRWTWLLVALIPLIGWIWEIVLLCKPSIPNDGTPVV